MKCSRCGGQPVWRVATIGGGGRRDSCLTCLGAVTADCAMSFKVFELRLTAIDTLGALA